MGLKKTDYSKLVIYKIKCNDESVLEFYVGSTTNFTKRKNRHKKNVENGDKQKIYETIRANKGWSNWTMVEVEVYPCNFSTEARIREEYWRETLQASLNQRRAYRSEEKKAEYNKQYLQEHADEIKAKKTQKFNCECGGKYIDCHKAKHERTLKHQIWKKDNFIMLEEDICL